VTPKPIAMLLRGDGFGSPLPFGRLTLAAAAASLRDEGYIAAIRSKVVAERDKWRALFERMKLNYSDSRGNFVFFRAGRPQQELATALLGKGIEIGRAFPPLNEWTRISIGLPDENDRIRAAVEEVLR
jgi:histidinol-phosphate aminotransferase